MTRSLNRRHMLATLGALGGGSLLTLTGCGGRVYQSFQPKRIISIGDALSDVGQTGQSWTVNDGSLNRTFIEQLSARYGITIKVNNASNPSGTAYGYGGALINGGANSIQSQVDAAIAAGIQSTDLIIVQGGTQDIVNAFTANNVSTTTSQSVYDAGKSLAAQVKRLVNAGAQYMVVSGVYNLGATPWGIAQKSTSTASSQSAQAFLQQITSGSGQPAIPSFNASLNVGISGLGRNIMFYDMGNLIATQGRANSTNAICTTPNASTCTPANFVPNASLGNYLFADALYPNPDINRALGDAFYTFATNLF